MSLDGLEETHDFIRKKGSFSATLSKLNCLKKAGIATTIMATVSKSNIDEIPSLVDVVVKYDVDNFAFARYCPNPDDFQNIVSAEEYHKFLGTMWEKFIYYKESHTKFVLKDHLWTLFLYENGLFNIDGINNPKNMILDGCRCGISHMTVLSDGTVYSCRRCESPIGKVPEESLYDIFSVTVWNNIDTTKNLKNAQSANLEIFVVAVRQSLNVYLVTFMVKILNVGKQLNNMSKPVLIFSKRVLLFFFSLFIILLEYHLSNYIP